MYCFFWAFHLLFLHLFDYSEGLSHFLLTAYSLFNTVFSSLLTLLLLIVNVFLFIFCLTILNLLLFESRMICFLCRLTNLSDFVKMLQDIPDLSNTLFLSFCILTLSSTEKSEKIFVFLPKCFICVIYLPHNLSLFHSHCLSYFHNSYWTLIHTYILINRTQYGSLLSNLAFFNMRLTVWICPSTIPLLCRYLAGDILKILVFLPKFSTCISRTSIGLYNLLHIASCKTGL